MKLDEEEFKWAYREGMHHGALIVAALWVGVTLIMRIIEGGF